MSPAPAQIQLVRLAIQDVGVLDGRLDLGPFEPGVTILSARSPLSRATLLAALDAALFERHDARHMGILALRARGTGTAPEIRLDLSVGGERMSVHKRFLDRPLAEVRLPNEGALFTGAKAEEVLSTILGPRAPDRAQHGLLAAGLDFMAQHRDLSARLAAMDGELLELERARKRAEGAEARARGVAALAEESEIDLANAEASFNALHGEMTSRAALIGELDEPVTPTNADAASRRGRVSDTLVALRVVTSDTLLDARHAQALAALAPAHRRARSAAVALDAATPQLLRGETVRALGEINACKRRARALHDRLTALTHTWSLPLVLEEPAERSAGSVLRSTLHELRCASGELRILVLAGHPSRLDRAHVDHAMDLDDLREERRRTPDLDGLSG